MTKNPKLQENGNFDSSTSSQKQIQWIFISFCLCNPVCLPQKISVWYINFLLLSVLYVTHLICFIYQPKVLDTTFINIASFNRKGACRNRYDDDGDVAKENVAGVRHITHITLLIHIYYLVTYTNCSEKIWVLPTRVEPMI